MFEPVEPKPKPSPRNVHFDSKDVVISTTGNISTQSNQPHLPCYTPAAATNIMLAPADHSKDVSRLLSANSTPYQPPPPWTPKEPESPMKQLINLGFGNRELNAKLLHKHNNSIQAVVNELLDAQC